MSRLGDPRLRLAGLVAAVVVVVDQVTKAVVQSQLALHESLPLSPFFSLTYARNPGAAFSLLATAPAGFRLPFFLAVAVVAIVALSSLIMRVPVTERWLVGAFGAILGGALGNLVCRLRYGEVVDFLDFHWGDLYWPAFNVADSAITVGVTIVLFRWLREPSS